VEYLVPIMIIAGVSLAGEILAHIISFPIPAAVYALVIMFALLCLKIIKLEWVEKVSMAMISVMLIVFIPPTVSFMEIAANMRGQLPAMILLLALTAVLVMGFTGLVAQITVRAEEKRIKKKRYIRIAKCRREGGGK